MQTRIIPNTDNMYSATEAGDIIAHPRSFTITGRWGNKIKCTAKEKTLKKVNHPGGYDSVSVWYMGKREKRYVHRLVAAAFYGDRPDMVVNHIDHNKKNNRVSNLEWTTPVGNAQHSVKHMRHGGPHGKQRYSIADRRIIAEEAIAYGIKTTARKFNLYFGYVSKLACRYRKGEFNEVA